MPNNPLNSDKLCFTKKRVICKCNELCNAIFIQVPLLCYLCLLVNLSRTTVRFPESSSAEASESRGEENSSNLHTEGYVYFPKLEFFMLISFRKQFGGGAPGASFGIPGYGKVTSYSKTPLGGHYTYVNQGPGYSHKLVPLFQKLVEKLLVKAYIDTKKT